MLAPSTTTTNAITTTIKPLTNTNNNNNCCVRETNGTMPGALTASANKTNSKFCNNSANKFIQNSISPDSLSSDLLDSLGTLKVKKKVNPSPIALEPCCGSRAAVLSLLVQLPTGTELYTPIGHPGGLAIASTLVTLGNPRKSSSEPVAVTKGDIYRNKTTRGKQPYSNHSTDTCI